MSEDNMSEHTMRAVTISEFGGAEALNVEEVARPVPLPTEVLRLDVADRAADLGDNADVPRCEDPHRQGAHQELGLNPPT